MLLMDSWFQETYVSSINMHYLDITDVYYKDTDAHRYLSFLSTHPPHTFKSVIYSSF